MGVIDGMQAISNSKFKGKNFALRLMSHPHGVIPWWYRALGTFRTQFLGLWRPGKPGSHFEWLKNHEIQKTHFLTLNGSRIGLEWATKAHETILERYWHLDFMFKRGPTSRDATLSLQSPGKGRNRKTDFLTSKCNFSKNVSLNWLKP